MLATTFGRTLFLAALPLVASLALGGCAVESEDAADADSSEDALTGSQALESLSAPKQLLAAKSYPTGATGPARTDVQVTGVSRTPRQVRRFTTSSFTWAGAKRVLLDGNTTGSARIVADDFLLIEVLDTATGAVLGARVFGSANEVKVNGAVVPAATVVENHVEITSLLPSNRAFRLRLTGFDLGAAASVGDVFLATTDAPVPSTNPFDPGYCQGSALTVVDMRTRFIAPVQVFKGRTRGCPTCEWKDLEAGGLALASDQGIALMSDLTPSASLGRTASGGTTLVVEDSDFRHEYCAQGYPRSCYIPHLAFQSTLDLASGETAAWLKVQTASTADATLKGTVSMRATTECYQFVSSRTLYGNETQVVIAGKISPR